MSAIPSVSQAGHTDRQPLDVATWEEGAAPWVARHLAAATWAFVAIGVLLRVIRYAMQFPLWGDEAFLAVNLLDRGYRDLLRPLEYGQICALLFLWVQHTVIKLFGFSELSLRLFPLVCGVASVFLFRHVTGRLLRGVPLLLAVGIFAVSYHPIRHAADAKPYASDLLTALILLAPALEWWRAPQRTGWLWALAAVVPLALALSHPAVFVAGGLALGMAIPVWKTCRWRARLPFALFLIAMVGTFLFLYALVTSAQSRGTLEAYKHGVWAPAFPPLDNPVRLLVWFLTINTGTMFAYPWGGARGSSCLTTFCCAVAAAFLWRNGRRDVLLALLGPFLLTLAAAVLGRYPYGYEARQMQFVAPTICLLAGLGAAVLLRATPRPRLQPWLVGSVVLLLTGTGLDLVRRDVAHPYRFLADHQARAFARRFWPALERDAEVACARQDFQVVNHRSLNLRTALHVCNQRIYSPSRRQGGGPRWDAVSASRPLRCVLYHETPPDIPEAVSWMNGMRSRYDLRRTERVEVDMSGAKAGPKQERWLVFEFVPKTAEPAAASNRLEPPIVR
jgi:hypothetical protein